MTPERWQHIQQIFDAVVDMDEEERASVLRHACGEDSTLHRQVESLIWSSKASGGFIEAAIVEAAQTATDEAEPRAANDKVGSYRIVREIGRGGMGAVYLAVRDDDEYQKQVAIKLVRSGMNTRELLHRFRAERQILANLDHPYIARLLDGGTTENGEPYVVMEYVDGEPIDEYSDHHELSTSSRLRLFLKVCEALRYAHQNLVVHRDIKPSNVLVTADGSPRLLDFGIAKLLSSESNALTLTHTRTGLHLMTPEYASPEQVRGLPVTTASDVYALGVMLYELLTGHRPYKFKSYLPLEIERTICEQQPERPSTVITRGVPGGESTNEDQTIGVSAEALSRRRASTTEKLKRQLAGDLDNIVLMAMRKEPERRYSSVEQLSEDLQRHLAGLPVLARQTTLSYRATKFVRRHTAGVIAAASMVVLIAALIGFYTWRLKQERDRAQAEATKAEQVSKFLTRLFEASNPSEAKGEAVTAKELLDRGASRVAMELAGQPEVQAEMSDVMGMAYLSLGITGAAAPLLERSLEVRRRTYGDNHSDVALSLNHLGSLSLAKSDYKTAGALYREALAIERRVSGGDNAATADLLNNLGEVEIFNANYVEAERLYREAMAINRRLYGEDHREIATNLSNLGSVMNNKGNAAEALKFFREGLEMRRRILGNEHPDVAYSLHNLATTLFIQGDYNGAEPLYRESLAMRRKMLGEDHPLVSNNASNLALVLIEKGQLDEAETLLRRTLETYRRTLPDGHEYFTRPLLYLGRLLMKRNDAKQAEALLREALKIRQEGMNSGNWRIAEVESVLGECLLDQDRYGEAEELLVGSYAIFNDTFRPGDRRWRDALKRVIRLYEDWEKPNQVAHYRSVLDPQ